MRFARSTVAGAAAFAVLLTGCASSHHAQPRTTTQSAAAPEAGRPDPHRFLATNPAARRVRLTMVASLGSSNNGFNFDDYGRGELIVSVPQGWGVTVAFRNHASRRTSCAVVDGARSATLAFPGATVPDPVQGLSPGSTAHFSFTASRPGSYRLASLVPGQAEARMYAVLVVTLDGRPSITARPGP